MSATSPFSTPPRIFTLVTNNTAVFKLDPSVAECAGVKAMSIQWISGAVTVRGNAGTINVLASDGTTPATLSDSAISLGATLSLITLIGNGNDALACTIDSSAGMAAIIMYI